MAVFSIEFQILKQADCERYQDMVEVWPIQFVLKAFGLLKQNMGITELFIDPEDKILQPTININIMCSLTAL